MIILANNIFRCAKELLCWSKQQDACTMHQLSRSFQFSCLVKPSTIKINRQQVFITMEPKKGGGFSLRLTLKKAGHYLCN